MEVYCGIVLFEMEFVIKFEKYSVMSVYWNMRGSTNACIVFYDDFNQSKYIAMESITHLFLIFKYYIRGISTSNNGHEQKKNCPDGIDIRSMQGRI